MFTFLKQGTSDQPLEKYSAELSHRLRENDAGTEQIEGAEETGFFHDMSQGGTGLYSDHEFKIGSELIFNLHDDTSDVSGQVGVKVLWSRLQDRDNIAAICIRRMIFSQYEEQSKEIEKEILQLLHSPGRSSTDQLIQKFSIFTLANLKILDGLKIDYIETHPQTANRFGAKIMDQYKENWKLFSDKMIQSHNDEEENASEVMKQFNRRSSQR